VNASERFATAATFLVRLIELEALMETDHHTQTDQYFFDQEVN
jgi:hypothetical protein